MDPLETYPLTLNLTHKWDDEADTTIKTSILSYLTSTKTSAYEVALDISLAFKPEHNIDGFRDEVEDICIYTSKFLPANHVAQDKLVEIVEAVRGLPECVGQPQWRYLLQTGSYSLVEAFGAQELYNLHIDTPENQVKRSYLRNLNAFMARLTRDGVSGCSYQALIAFSQALETPEPYTTTRTMDVLIVYDWLRLAGTKLMAAEIKDARVRGELWDEEKQGFSQERWKFWRSRLEDLEGHGEYEVQAREVAGEARNVLDQLMAG